MALALGGTYIGVNASRGELFATRDWAETVKEPATLLFPCRRQSRGDVGETNHLMSELWLRDIQRAGGLLWAQCQQFG